MLKEMRQAAFPWAAGLKPTALDLWLALLLATGVLGAVAVVVGFVQGHEKVFTVELGVPWGILVSTYVFFVVTSTGMCLVSSLGHVFGIERFKPLGRRAVFLAILTLIAGFIAMGAELERPWRMLAYVVLTPNFSSAIWWMGTLYVVYLIFLVVEFIFLSRGAMVAKSQEFTGVVAGFYRMLALGSRDTSEEGLNRNMRFARWAGAGGVSSAIAAHSTLGAVFGLLEARALWYGPYLPIYFILSALVSGAAILALVTLLRYKVTGTEMGSEARELVMTLGRTLLLLLGILVFFMTWKTIGGLYGHVPEKSEALMLLMNGPLSLMFWGLEVFVGIAIPFFLLLNPRTRTPGGVGAASLLVLVGLFAARYDLVIAGQLVPLVGGAGVLNYVPSATEAIIVAGVFALCALLYTLGERTLALGEGE